MLYRLKVLEIYWKPIDFCFVLAEEFHVWLFINIYITYIILSLLMCLANYLSIQIVENFGIHFR